MKKIFYAMPFTDKSFEEITKKRRVIATQLKKLGMALLEQFIGVETKKYFKQHGYQPIFVAEKDHVLLARADLVIADYEKHSIGRDCEIVFTKEILDKKVISIVKNPHQQKHPWIRMYSDYIVSSQKEAFDLAKKISIFPLPQRINFEFGRKQKDETDILLKKLYQQNPQRVYDLLPTELKTRWQVLFKKEYGSLLSISFETLPVNLRINTLKTTVKDFVKNTTKKYGWKLEPLPFSKTAFQISGKWNGRLWNLEEYKQGLFYVQEYASMLPAIILDPKPREKILDIAAAPGSKTTQVAEMMKNTGWVLANDNSKERLKILKSAAKRNGITNIQQHLGDGSILGEAYKEKFDKVMVDAPCSSEGIFRYKAHKLFEWRLLQLYRLTKTQRKLIESGFQALKPGGVLVYSTCTFSPEENELVVKFLLDKFPNAKLESINLPGVKVRPGLQRWGHLNMGKEMCKTVRIYPQDNNTIGFFIAKIKKLK